MPIAAVAQSARGPARGGTGSGRPASLNSCPLLLRLLNQLLRCRARVLKKVLGPRGPSGLLAMLQVRTRIAAALCTGREAHRARAIVENGSPVVLPSRRERLVAVAPAEIPLFVTERATGDAEEEGVVRPLHYQWCRGLDRFGRGSDCSNFNEIAHTRNLCLKISFTTFSRSRVNLKNAYLKRLTPK